MFNRYPAGCLALEAVGDGRTDRAGLGQGTQQELGGVEVRVGSIDLIFPHSLSGEQETLVVVGLEQVAEVPVILPDGRRRVVWAGFQRLLQPQAQPGMESWRRWPEAFAIRRPDVEVAGAVPGCSAPPGRYGPRRTAKRRGRSRTAVAPGFWYPCRRVPSGQPGLL